MGRLSILGHRYSWGCDFWLCMWHECRTHQGMGLCTCLLCKPSYWNIPGLWCTLVCTRCMGLPANQEDKHKQLRHFAPCILHLYHKARDCMGQWFQVLVEELRFIFNWKIMKWVGGTYLWLFDIVKMDLQNSPYCKHRWVYGSEHDSTHSHHRDPGRDLGIYG